MGTESVYNGLSFAGHGRKEENPAISDGITDLVGTMVHEVSATQEDHTVRSLRHVDSKRQHHTGHICGRQRWGLDSGRLGCE